MHAFYLPTWQSGFVTDFTGLAERIETRQFWDFWRSFDFPSLQPVLNFFLVIFYKSFGTNGLPWYLIFTTLHILNGFLLYRFTLRLTQAFQIKQADFIAIGSALIFLLSPYASEPVTWRVCFNFLFTSLLILSVLWHTLRWLQTDESRFRNYTLLLFLVALFTFELSLTAPFLALMLVLLWTFHVDEKSKLRSRILKSFLPQIAMIGGYFLLTRLSLGTWIGHYGSDVHLRLIPREIAAHAYQYFAKYLFFARYFEHPNKMALFEAFNKPWVLYGAIGVSLILLAAYMRSFKRLAPRTRLLGWSLLAFFISLSLMLNLYFNYLLHVENDRYGYLASMFFGIFLATLFSFLPNWGRYLALASWLIISGFLLQKTNRYWSESTQVFQSLLTDFRWETQDTVYILNLPDNYNGVLLFRDYSGNDRAFADALRYVHDSPFDGKIFEVGQYNMTSLADGVSAVQDSTGVIVPTFNQWGNWWWRRGIGASAYETGHYSFETKGQSYELRLKSDPGNTVFIYQDGLKWRELEVSQ